MLGSMLIQKRCQCSMCMMCIRCQQLNCVFALDDTELSAGTNPNALGPLGPRASSVGLSLRVSPIKNLSIEVAKLSTFQREKHHGYGRHQA